MVGFDGFDGFVTMIQRHVRFGSNGVLWKRRVNEWNWIDWQIYIYIYAIVVMLVDRGRWIMFRSLLTWRYLGITCSGISGIDRNDDNVWHILIGELWIFELLQVRGKKYRVTSIISIKRPFQRIKFLISFRFYIWKCDERTESGYFFKTSLILLNFLRDPFQHSLNFRWSHDIQKFMNENRAIFLKIIKPNSNAISGSFENRNVYKFRF